MTNEEIARMVLKPVIEEMRASYVEAAVGASFDEAGDNERRNAALSVKLLDEINNRIGEHL